MMKNFKKIVLSVLGVAVLTVGFIGCSGDDPGTNNNEQIEVESTTTNDSSNTVFSSYSNVNLDLNKEIKLDKSTDLISELLYTFGATEIEVYNMPDEVNRYEVKTRRGFEINRKSLNFADYVFLVENNIITLVDNGGVEKVKLSLFEGEPVEVKEGKVVRISQESIKNTELLVGLLFMKEIVLDASMKATIITYDNALTASGGCSFWNTYYVYSAAGSESVAEANLPGEIEHYTTTGFNTLGLSNCSMVGGVDTSCIWGSHYCISTQAFCCDCNGC